MKEVIVTRHPATVEFVKQQLGRDDIPVIASATAEDVRGATVYGNLPLHLAAEAAKIVAVEFAGTPPRGAEYGINEMIAAGARLQPYTVRTV